MEKTMLMYMVGLIGIALVITLVLEAPVIWLRLGKDAKDKKKFMLNFVLINAITNITLNTCVLLGFMLGPILYIGIIAAELVIPLIEAKMYQYTTKEFTWKELVVACYIANAVSFFIGSGLIWLVR